MSDAVGSSLVEIDNTGAIVSRSTLRPFGGIEDRWGSNGGSGGTSGTNGREYYAGHDRQQDTGLVYMNARWMDPGAGTFISVDPVVADAFDPQAYTGYAYVRNNPVNLDDPTGMTPAGAFFGGVIGGGSYVVAQKMKGEEIRTSELLLNIGFGAFAGGTLNARMMAQLSGPQQLVAIVVGSSHLGVIREGLKIVSDGVNGARMSGEEVAGRLIDGASWGIVDGLLGKGSDIASSAAKHDAMGAIVEFEGQVVEELGKDLLDEKTGPDDSMDRGGSDHEEFDPPESSDLGTNQQPVAERQNPTCLSLTGCGPQGPFDAPSSRPSDSPERATAIATPIVH